jgi:signal transduction histidine kinase
MGQISFSVSARTASLIGHENFSNVEGAIVELVKNAYDADSQYCFVVFSQDEQGSPCLFILDFGSGMSDDIIKNCWMRIGTNDKLDNVTTPNGRVKSGAKGIGRFALNRLGEKAAMYTIIKDGPGFKWTVDWNRFNDPTINVSDVTADLDNVDLGNVRLHVQSILDKIQSNLQISEVDKHFPDFTNGTLLEITKLNDLWNEEKLESLFDNLVLLVPPFVQNDFKIYIHSDQFPEKFGLIQSENFEDYDYKVSAHYDNDKKEIIATIERNELDPDALMSFYANVFNFDRMKLFPYRREDFANKTFTITKKLSDLKNFNSEFIDNNNVLGDFDFSFFYIKNSIGDIKSEGERKKFPYKSFSNKTRKNWLAQFAGVKIYRDNFRIRPYGERGEDWLKLGEAQAKSPSGAGQRMGGYHIRPNQISGVISISRLTNGALDDKSGREGIQENAAFEFLQKIVRAMISLFEEDRNTVMYNLSQLYNKENAVEKAKIVAEEAIKSGVINTDNYQKLVEGYNAAKRELEDKESEIQLMRNLASTGLLISSFGHELRSIDLALGGRTDMLRQILNDLIPEEDLAQVNKYQNPYTLIDALKDEDANIKAWLDFSINSIRKDRRTRTNVNLKDYFSLFKLTWGSIANQFNIQIIVSEIDPTFEINVFQVDLDTVFNNLLSNSISFIRERKSTENRKIEISVSEHDDYVDILFIDYGIGLNAIYENDPYKIFDSFESSKCDKNGNQIGTGLGLYIVKTTLQDYAGARIKIIPNLVEGFGLSVTFKLLQNG